MKLLDIVNTKNKLKEIANNVGSAVGGAVQSWIDKPSNQMVNSAIQSWQNRPSNQIANSMYKSVNDFFQPSPNGVRTRDIVRELPRAAGDVAVDSFVRPTTRAMANVGLSIRELLGGSGQASPDELAMALPNKGVRDFIFGDKPLSSIQSQKREVAPQIKDSLTKYGVDPILADKLSNPLAIAGITGVTALDAFPNDPTDLVKAGGRSVKGLLNPKTLDEVANTAKVVEDAVPTTERAIKGAKQTIEDQLKLVESGSQSVDDIVSTNKLSKTGDWLRRNLYEPYRYITKKLPYEDQKVFDESIAKPLMKLRGDAADFKKYYQAAIDSIPFKSGSEESAAMQKFGESVITKDDLIKKFGEQTANTIEQSANLMKGLYSDILDKVNNLRINAGLNPIEKRNDYFRHIGELGNMFSDLTRSKGNDPISSSIMKHRTGDKTRYDAIGGFMNYLEYAGRAGFTDTITPKIREMANAVSKAGDTKFSEYLNNWANDILGANPSPGGALGVVDKIGSKIRQSRVLGNLSTIVNQMASLPTGIKMAGINNTLRGNFSDATKLAEKSSNFIKDVSYRPDISKFKGPQIIKRAAAILQDADIVSKKTVWRGMYEQALQAGVKDPIAVADQMTELAMGGRGIGSQSKFQQSLLGKFIAPFTNEAQAQANTFFQEIKKMNLTKEGRKAASNVIGIMIGNHIFNNIAEKIYGNRPTPDLIQASIDSYRKWTGDDKTEQNKLQAIARLAGELLNSQPVAQGIALNMYNLAQVMDPNHNVIPSSKNVFGSDDPTRMASANLYNPFSVVQNRKRITGNTAIDSILEAGSRLAPFGNQVSKTTQAAASLADGFARTKSGAPMYEMPKNPINQLQALAFGQSSTPQAQEYFNNDFNRPLNKTQTKVFDNLPNSQKSAFIQNVQKNNQVINKMKSETANKGWLNSIINKNETSLSDNFIPNSKEQQKEYTNMVNSLLDGGVTPTTKQLSIGVFGGKDVTVTSLKDRSETYAELHKMMTNEYLSDGQREAILKASKATPQQYNYYRLASLDKMAALQEILPEMGDLSNPENFKKLMLNRAKVGGKEVLDNSMIDYLYDRDYISKDQKELLKATQFDELTGEFYWKKDSKFGGGGSGKGKKLTYSQALKLFNIDIPKLTNKDLTSYINSLMPDISQKMNKTIQDILSYKG
jgi:hypothetical protein